MRCRRPHLRERRAAVRAAVEGRAGHRLGLPSLRFHSTQITELRLLVIPLELHTRSMPELNCPVTLQHTHSSGYSNLSAPCFQDEVADIEVYYSTEREWRAAGLLAKPLSGMSFSP